MQRLPVAIARTGSFEAQVRDLPYRGCAAGCGDRRSPAPRFAAAALEAVMGGALPVAHPLEGLAVRTLLEPALVPGPPPRHRRR